MPATRTILASRPVIHTCRKQYTMPKRPFSAWLSRFYPCFWSKTLSRCWPWNHPSSFDKSGTYPISSLCQPPWFWTLSFTLPHNKLKRRWQVFWYFSACGAFSEYLTGWWRWHRNGPINSTTNWFSTQSIWKRSSNEKKEKRNSQKQRNEYGDCVIHQRPRPRSEAELVKC